MVSIGIQLYLNFQNCALFSQILEIETTGPRPPGFATGLCSQFTLHSIHIIRLSVSVTLLELQK